MKLVQISHYRCGDYDATQYYMVPDGMSEEDMRKTIDTARDTYLNLSKRLNDLDKPDYPKKDIESFDESLTIKQAKERVQNLENKRKEWQKLYEQKSGSFRRTLEAAGFVSLSNVEDKFLFEVDWGHNHALPLNYND